LTRTSNYEQATTMIEKCRAALSGKLEDQEDLTLLNLEARIARAGGEDAKAAKLLAQIIERDALNGEAIIELANYHADTGDMAKAINRYQQAEKIEKFERQALVAHAQARVREGDYKAALPLLRRALQLKQDRNLADYTDRVERAARAQG
jgi:tetratricopeptide (TPR) repeat protein